MSHGYSGNPSFPADITIPDDGDLDAAVAYAVALEQLADRTVALSGGGVGGDFTDATFHGTTTFADGTIGGTVTSISLGTTGSIILAADVNITIAATGDAFLLATSDLGIGGATCAVGITASSFDVMTGIIHIAGTTIDIGNNAATQTLDIDVSSIDIGSAQFLANSSSAMSLGGTNVFTSTSDTSVDGGGVFRTSNGGKLRLQTQLRAANFTANGTTGYEHIFTDNPGAPVAVTVNHTGAAMGQRMRFNAQNVVTGVNDYVIAYGSRTWFMRNAAAKTVALEFVSDGSAWVVDDHAEGGDALRDG